MASDAAAAPKETMRRDYMPPAFLAPKLDIFVRLSADGKDVTVGARTAFAANPEYIARAGLAAGTVPALQLDVELKHVDVQAVRVNGKEIAADAFTKDEATNTLTISAAALADAAPEALTGGEFVVETVNKQNPVENLVSSHCRHRPLRPPRPRCWWRCYRRKQAHRMCFKSTRGLPGAALRPEGVAGPGCSKSVFFKEADRFIPPPK